MDKKIFYLGFQKCGTTSFWQYFSDHGFRGIHNTKQVCRNIELALQPQSHERLDDLIDTVLLRRFVDEYDVLTDNPFPLLYEYFDESYKDALFVLGTRPTDEWLRSMQRYFGSRMPALGHAIYASDGNACSDPDRFCKTYDQHNTAVRRYFSGRPNFLEIRLGQESNDTITGKLENFVGLPKGSNIKFGRHLPL